ALSAPGQPEGTSEPSDFDALLEHHKATEAENALFKRALEYIVRRGYHGASFVADKALAGIDVTAALSAPGQPPCKQCDGSGKVHSHNDICWVCDGTGHAPSQKEGDE
ncbi:MAG: hypothetical protein KBA95_01955, partial [Acidobacteria bacterium]|nr:hypothetical protein [Acidobacteriota bacterium]